MALTRINNNSLSAVTAAGIPKGTGEVLQVVNYNESGVLSTSSTTIVDTGMEVTLTPQSASSKMLIMANLGLVSFTGTSDGVRFYIYKNGSLLETSTGASSHNTFMQVFHNANNHYQSESNMYMDTAGSTGSITYKLRWARTGGSDTIYINRRGSDNFARANSTFTVMEIAG